VKTDEIYILEEQMMLNHLTSGTIKSIIRDLEKSSQRTPHQRGRELRHMLKRLTQYYQEYHQEEAELSDKEYLAAYGIRVEVRPR